jgi:hypothetical protein
MLVIMLLDHTEDAKESAHWLGKGCTHKSLNPKCKLQVVYSEFLDLVKSGNVQQARIDESLQKVYFSVRPRPAEELSSSFEAASTSGAGHLPSLHFCSLQS